MSGLTPEAEKLVRAGREAFRPSDDDRKRVLGALLPKLGGDSGGGVHAPSPAPAVAKATLVKSGAILVGLGIAGAGAFLALRPEPAAPPKSSVVAPATPVIPSPPSPAPQRDESASVAPVAPEAPRVEKPQASTPRPANGRPDDLAQEVAILSRAGAELHGGRPQAALATLEEHQRKFPGGILAQERVAARVQALCALGRTKEAQAELGRLSRLSPNSPHEARARKACGSALSEKK